MLRTVLLWSVLLVNTILAISIKGQFDVSPYNISNVKISNTHFKLQQIGDIEDNKHPIKSVAYIQDSNGTFQFNNIELNKGVNKTTQFVISPISKDFNLKPNRVLVEFKEHENGTIETRGFKNYFGREYFPSKDIKFPEHLESIAIEPMVTFSLVQKQPFRQYLQVRNIGILSSGPIASILHSRWKMSLLVVALGVIAFPIYIENFDPETVKAMKEQKQRQKREKYQFEN
ncbi:protein Sop4p [Monosporozyma servazzii]